MTADEFFGKHNPVLDENETLHKFGNYTIKGDIKCISSVTQNNIFSSLYYNYSRHQYFLVKIFASNKIHIDFFITNKGIQKEIFLGNEGFGYAEIGSTKDEVKTLFFSFMKECYYVDSFVGDKVYTLYFNEE